MNNLIKTAIIGCTGYTGIELVKLISKHKKVKILELGSRSQFSKEFSDLFPKIKLSNKIVIKKNDEIDVSKLDLVFVCLPHIESQKYISNIIDKVKIIDLSGDFRLKKIEDYKKWYNSDHNLPDKIKEFTYGLSEIFSHEISKSQNISVPGCYPTSILIPLFPLIKNKLIKFDNIIIDSKSGYSGAGKNFDLKKLIYNNKFNFYNYNTNNHRHIPEIEQELSLAAKDKVTICFNPHILPVERGIISSIYCSLESRINFEKIKECLIDFYKNKKFISIIDNNKEISIFDVINTNQCIIKLYNNDINNSIIITSYIDNLIKGASGQAVQNMNIMFNLKEDESLI